MVRETPWRSMPPASIEANLDGRSLIASYVDDAWVGESIMRLAVEPTRWALSPGAAFGDGSPVA